MELLVKCFIHPSSSPCGAHVFFVEKRMVVYHHLNQVSTKLIIICIGLMIKVVVLLIFKFEYKL